MPTSADALSSVYARSLFDLAQQAGGQSKIDEIASELEQIVSLMREQRSFREFLASPVIDRKSRSASLSKILGNRVTDLTLRFLLVLNDNGRLNHLEPIVAAFDSLVQDAYGRIEVDVYTASPLSSEGLSAVRSRIQAALGKEPVLHPYTDPNMIGGLKLRIGDQLIDGSVASQLRRMKRDLQNSGAARVREQGNRFVQD